MQRIVRRPRQDEGLTLIELMVVVLVIALLVVIGIPTFLGAKTRSQDRAVQSSLRNTVTSAKAVFSDTEDYATAVADNDGDSTPNDELRASEPNLEFLPAAANSADQTDISVASDNAPGSPSPKHTRLVAAAMSDSGVCWYVQEVAGPSGIPAGTGGQKWARNDDAATCNAASAPGYTDTAWSVRPSDSSDIP